MSLLPRATLYSDREQLERHSRLVSQLIEEEIAGLAAYTPWPWIR
jgi:hypothetical protein